MSSTCLVANSPRPWRLIAQWAAQAGAAQSYVCISARIWNAAKAMY
jgi:hypothetical protein